MRSYESINKFSFESRITVPFRLAENVSPLLYRHTQEIARLFQPPPSLILPKLTCADSHGLADDFQARSPDELSLAKGDRIELIERDDDFGDGWFLGKHLQNKMTGLFPEGGSSNP